MHWAVSMLRILTIMDDFSIFFDLIFSSRELIEELHPIIKEALERRPEVINFFKKISLGILLYYFDCKALFLMLWVGTN